MCLLMRLWHPARVCSVSIKGTQNEEAVLCTSDKTFSLRLAESSNSFMITPKSKKRPLPVEGDESTSTEADGKEVLEVQASIGAYFELIRSAPRTGGLLALLSAWPHRGTDDVCDDADEEADPDAAADATAPPVSKCRLSLQQLETAVQCSIAELRTALQECRALEVDGGWCVLDPQFEMDIVECVLSLCVEHEWPLSAVPTAECVRHSLEQFPGFDERSIRHCLRTHSEHANAAWDVWTAAATQETIALDSAAIARFRARALLAEADNWPREQFFEAWAENLPAGHVPDAALLAGLAITLPPSPGSDEAPRLQGLPASALSPVPKERFKALFMLKRSWTLDELTPYVRPLLDPGAAPTKLVLQFARSVYANDGSLTYVSR